MKKLLTHNGIFHCDELVAINLLRIFTKQNFEIVRNSKVDNEENYEYIVDIGNKYDGYKFFDHHQNKALPSAAKLVWTYIITNFLKQVSEENGFFKSLDNLVNKVSWNDTDGACKDDCFISMISALNNKNNGFEEALNISYNLMKNLADSMHEEEIKLKKLKDSEQINGFVIYEDSNLPLGWRDVANNGVVSINLRGGWNVISKDTNKLILPESEKATFRHNSGFMLVFATKMDALEYIQNLNLKEKA